MWSNCTKGRLKRLVSFFCALALVFTSAIPIQAKTSKVTQIQCVAPLSDKGKTVKTTLTLKKGKTFQIKTKSAGKKLTYKSSRKKVAVVSKKGKIKAKKVGKTKITISPKGNKKVKAVITVTVVKSLKKVKKIKLNTNQLSLIKGASGQLKASIVSPKKPTTKKINWFSSNKKVATVNKKGMVTAKGIGTAKVTVAAADGQGAKAVCQVSVKQEIEETPSVTGSVNPSGSPNTVSAVPSNVPDTSSDPNASDDPNASNTPATASPSSTPAAELTIVEKDTRTSLLQREKIQLTAAGPGSDTVTWKVDEVTGVTISDTGLLEVAADASTKAKIKVTVTSSADVAVKTATAEFSILENKTKPVTDSQILINEDTEKNPIGLTFRSNTKTSKVVDKERGEVLRFDANDGTASTNYDRLAWLELGSQYAGKTVHVSCYMKYEAKEGDLTDDQMNLIVEASRNYQKVAVQYNAKQEQWYYIEGDCKLPSDPEAKTTFYIVRSADHLNAGKNVVYYISDLQFTVEKSVVEKVTVSTKDDITEVYQNHELQFTSEVTGTNGPSQEVDYSIEPAVTGASIDDTGLLKVGNVPAGTEITVKAVSREDGKSSGTKTITVLPQTVESVTVAPETKQGETAPIEIYAGQPVQFKADVKVTGDADSSVTWSVSPETAGASITQEGLLSVTDAVADNTKLTVKAVSKFDTEKESSYEITVRENKVTGVTISSAGGKTTVSSDSPLTLSVKVDTIGSFSGTVKWTFEEAVEGAKLSSEDGTTTGLSVSSNVAVGTKIVVCATSVEDTSKSATITITVASDTKDFDINKLNVEVWADFNGVSSIAEANSEMERIGVSGKVTAPTKPTGWKRLFTSHYGAGLGLIDTGASTALFYPMATADDYLEFTIDNTEEDAEKTYQLSFMARFSGIADETGTSDYQLPLEMILVKPDESEEKIKDDIKLSYRCDSNLETIHRGYHEIICEVKVPANQKINLRLKLKEGEELPGCIKDGCSYANVGHPFKLTIDNIAISSGTTSTLNMSVGDEVSLSLDTLEDDSVVYYTNSCLAKETHDGSGGTGDIKCECHNFDTVVASVDENGKITAETAGDTALIAVITHKDGSIERKQCIVHVTE